MWIETNARTIMIFTMRYKNGGTVEVDFKKELTLDYKELDEHPTAK